MSGDCRFGVEDSLSASTSARRPERYRRQLSRTARRLPMRVSIDRLSWRADDTLVIEGHGFIDGVPFDHPAAALRRIRLVDPGHGTERRVWVAPRRLPSMGRVRMTPSYEWSGFRAAIPLALLDPGPDQDSARWQVSLQVLALGAASGSALGPPLPGSGFDGVRRTASGLLVRVHWSDGKRLVIDSVRVSCALVDATTEDGMISLSLRLSPERSLTPHLLRLVSPTSGTASVVPLRSACSSTANGILRVLLDPGDLLAEHDALRRPAFRLALTTAAGDVDVTSELPSELTLTHEDGVLTFAEDDRGGVEVILGTARTVISGLSWRGDLLLITGNSSSIEDDLVGLSWSNEGDTIPATLRRVGGGFEAAFDLTEIAGPDVSHPVAAGEWTLMLALGDVPYRPAVTAGEAALSSTRVLKGVWRASAPAWTPVGP